METDIHLTIPMPLHIIVDDVGWWSGKDGSKFNQPFRTGMGRDHLPEDYIALAALGKMLNMKILAGFILCEWDKTNLLKKLPSSTWMGKDWNNATIRCDDKERAAEIIRNESDHIEISLHGIGHEFWINGKMHRAEFHDNDCHMRNRSEIRKHFEFFFKLMEQYHLSPLPVTFIPPALKHSFGNGSEGFQKLLNEFGIRYVTTCFDKARQFSKPLHPKITWESGVLIVDRGYPEPAWNDIGPDPVFAFDRPLLTLHWANILHKNPEISLSVVNKWVDFIQKGAKTNGLLLSKDIQSCFTQFLHKLFSNILNSNGEFSIDLTWMEKLPQNLIGCSFFIKIEKPPSVNLKIFGAEAVCIHKGLEASILKLTPHKGIKKILLKPFHRV
ncbi:MAG: hypothetical protein KJ826_00265 [Proteobacteria bacterium]|nr:hypothetical protein [Pseudomonadota bacterium]MBU4037374.1 hypothetical protein [Pseudomonadota bacterium]